MDGGCIISVIGVGFDYILRLQDVSSGLCFLCSNVKIFLSNEKIISSLRLERVNILYNDD